jgi:hypothetical protein
MIDFDNLREKAEELAEQHADQIDKGLDQAARMAGKKYGHGQQFEQAADKLEEMVTGGNDAEPGARRPPGKRGAPSGPHHGGRPGSGQEGPDRHRRPNG